MNIFTPFAPLVHKCMEVQRCVLYKNDAPFAPLVHKCTKVQGAKSTIIYTFRTLYVYIRCKGVSDLVKYAKKLNHHLKTKLVNKYLNKRVVITIKRL